MANDPDKLQTEIWKPVPGYEQSYLVSNMGQVRSLARLVNSKNGSKALKSGKILIGSISRGGYRNVGLSGRGKSKTTGVHRIVALAFLGLPTFNGAQVAHNDGNPGNNNVSNLRWDTAKGNALDRNLHGTAPIGVMAGNSKIKDSDVLEIRAKYNGKYGDLTRLGMRFGITASQVLNIVKRKQWTHI